jgi:hypothetical protein
MLVLSRTFAAGLIAAGAASILFAAKPLPSDALHAELLNRVAGPPQRCVELRRITATRALGKDLLFMEGSAVKFHTISPACPDSRGFALVTSTSYGRLCKGDLVGFIDVESGIEKGSCEVGEFTPYRRQ